MTKNDAAHDLDTLDVGIPEFWSRIQSATDVALLLDYDGTLAPFHVDRHQAIPTAGVEHVLEDIVEETDTHVALVSGRPVAEILSLMVDPGVTIIGTHGYEIRRPSEGVSAMLIDNTQTAILDQAEVDARSLIGDDRTERKIATVAVHFRGLSDDDARHYERSLYNAWLRYADPASVEIRQFNGGLEIRSLGRHKGIAVGEYLSMCPPGTLAVYLGDDDTDEDAFKVLREDAGYGIRVGELNGTTAAQGSLSSCDDVLTFLHRWKKERANQ